MIPCQVCGTPFKPVRKTHRNCSSKCRDHNSTRNYRATEAGRKSVQRQNASEASRARKRKWFENNPDYAAKYRKAYYMVSQSEPAERIVRIASRMTVSQRRRFADWLLRVDHKALRNHLADNFVANHNSAAI